MFMHLGENTSLLVTEDSYEAMQTNEELQNEDEPHNQPGIGQTEQLKKHVQSDIREVLKHFSFFLQAALSQQSNKVKLVRQVHI